MPTSPKTLQYTLGLPARPSVGRRCHTQRRVLLLFSLVLLVSSGSMIILHITTTPFERSNRPCDLSSAPAMADSACLAMPRVHVRQGQQQQRPSLDSQERLLQEDVLDRDQEYDRFRRRPYRSSDPRAASPRLPVVPSTASARPRPQPTLDTMLVSPSFENDRGDAVQEAFKVPNGAFSSPQDDLQNNDQDNNDSEFEQVPPLTIVNNQPENKEDPPAAPGLNRDENEDVDDKDDHEPSRETQRVPTLGEPLDTETRPFESTLIKEELYLTYLPYAGITNQFYAILRGIEVAQSLGRTLIIPPITASSHDKSKQSQPWSRFLDLDRFMQLTGVKVVELHELRDQERTEYNTIRCGIVCGFGSKRTIDFTAKGFLKQWRLNLTLEALPQDPTKLEAITGMLDANPLQTQKFLCISNAYKISVKDKAEWERYGQYLHFTKELEGFVQEFLNKNLVQAEPVKDPKSQQPVVPAQKYLAVHARRGDFAQYCEGNFAGSKMMHCLPSTAQIAQRINDVQTRLNPNMDPEAVMPVFVATNEQRPEELKRFADLGWKYLDHQVMGTADRLGVFGPMMVDQ
ncbi:hypothetical protein BGW38_009812 [Lunasporangiospora selenospora]|uniref:GDP-fucose protein O-fucosyltransferase 2 n=1 Tax=Lunasporangiospora selenospora TaxID=979761 RepID=A0A9P6FZ03_9FUNG|nr:hypothetical protein BGW38_009812 [Lunasporangiospora selenospora]